MDTDGRLFPNSAARLLHEMISRIGRQSSLELVGASDLLQRSFAALDGSGGATGKRIRTRVEYVSTLERKKVRDSKARLDHLGVAADLDVPPYGLPIEKVVAPTVEPLHLLGLVVVTSRAWNARSGAFCARGLDPGEQLHEGSEAAFLVSPFTTLVGVLPCLYVIVGHRTQHVAALDSECHQACVAEDEVWIETDTKREAVRRCGAQR
jgi:hypothetical protein